MLNLTNVQIVYDNTIEAVREASLAVGKGRIVALLGSNGAGKSTTLKGISGVLYPEDGEIKGGQITFENRQLTGLAPDEIVRAGVVMVPEGRRLFDQLTVEENLVMGGYTRSLTDARRQMEMVYGLFPRLVQKRSTVSGYLSGGEQIFDITPRLCRQEGMGILLVEQNAQMALAIADYGYIMENGRVVLDGEADKMLRNDDVREFYLGFGEGGSRKNMRDVKHYKRRKRWLS